MSMIKQIYAAIVERLEHDHPEASPEEIHSMAVEAYERGFSIRECEVEAIPGGDPAAGWLPVPEVQEVWADAERRGGPPHQTRG